MDRCEFDSELAEYRESLYANIAVTLEKLRDQSGKIVLNADDLFKLCPRYRDDLQARGALGPRLYPIARVFTDDAFAKLLSAPVSENNTVIFTAGGGASGKSTALRAQASKEGVEFVVDTTFSSPERALKLVSDALAAGRKVEVNYVFRSYEDSVRGMLLRACDPQIGRVVPIDDLARTHAGSQESIVALWEKHPLEPRLEVRLWENTGPNTLKRMSRKRFAALIHPPVDVLQEIGQHLLDEIFNHHDSQWPGGEITRALYQASRSQAQGTK